MGRMRGRLTRAERVASEHVSAVSCPECGETFRHAGDLALELVAAQWARVAEGEEATRHEEHPTVARVLDHPHEGLVDEALSDLPAFRHAR